MNVNFWYHTDYKGVSAVCHGQQENEHIYSTTYKKTCFLFFFFSKVSEAPGTYFGLKILAVPKLVVKTISASLLPHYVFDVIVLLKKNSN